MVKGINLPLTSKENHLPNQNAKVSQKYKSDSLEVVKIPRSKNYYAKFWVGREFRKSGYQIISLSTASQKEAEIKAKEIWFTFISTRKIFTTFIGRINYFFLCQCTIFFQDFGEFLFAQDTFIVITNNGIGSRDISNKLLKHSFTFRKAIVF